MTRFLPVPQLPQGRAAALAIGERYRNKLEKPLKNLDILVYFLPDDPSLDVRIASHADLLLLHLGGETFLARDSVKSAWYPPIDVKVPYNKEESALNCCAVGRYWICCRKTAALVPEGFEPVYVRQRYTRCSVCIVDERSIITADAGIAKTAALHGIDVLRIEPGHVSLPGFDTGFLGGASFKLSHSQIAFTGALYAHPDKRRIEAYLQARGVEPIYLTNEPIFDIGSAVLLTEEFSP